MPACLLFCLGGGRGEEGAPCRPSMGREGLGEARRMGGRGRKRWRKCLQGGCWVGIFWAGSSGAVLDFWGCFQGHGEARGAQTPSDRETALSDAEQHLRQPTADHHRLLCRGECRALSPLSGSAPSPSWRAKGRSEKGTNVSLHHPAPAAAGDRSVPLAGSGCLQPWAAYCPDARGVSKRGAHLASGFLEPV